MCKIQEADEVNFYKISSLSSALKLNSKNMILFIAGSILHLFISLLQFETLDWNIQWNAARAIADGVPFYDTKIGSGSDYSNNAYHFPLFFYLLALLIYIFGSNPVIGRLFLWICTVVLGILLLILIEPENEFTSMLTIGLYFLNPVVINVSYYGLFDQFLYLLVVVGFIQFFKGSYLFSGLFFGFAVMTKIIAILSYVPLVIILVKDKRVDDLFSFMLGFIISAGSIFTAFLVQYGEGFLYKSVGWQIIRTDQSMSVWYYLLGREYLVQFLVFQLFTIISIIFIMAKYSLTSSKEDILLTASFFNVLFLILIRNMYTHYSYWYIIPLIPALAIFHQREFNYELFLGIGSIILFHLGLFPCISNCYGEAGNWQSYHMLGALLSIIGLVFIVYLYYYRYISIRDFQN